MLVDQMVRKHESYRSGIEENHSLAKTMASRLARGGELETLCGDDDFLEEQRIRLKKLTETNIRNERELSYFVAALQRVGKKDQVDDYEAALENAMKDEQIRRNSMQLEINQERYYTEICSKLGELIAPNDDDLEVLAAESTHKNLKCPITGAFMENPVRNMVCGHVYEKKAILEHIRKDKQRRCPLPGCRNTNVAKEQLEQDRETILLVRREKKRQQKRQVQLSQTAIDADGEEDDDSNQGKFEDNS